MVPTAEEPTSSGKPDNHLGLIAAATLAAGGALVACFLPTLWFADRSPPTPSLLSSVSSPDGTRVATLFEESGGGAAGYRNPNVAIHEAGAVFDPRERLLLDGGYLGVEVRWLANRSLEVSYRHASRASKRRTSAQGVEIVYRQR